MKPKIGQLDWPRKIRDKTQITENRKERRDITISFTEIKRILREYYE